MTRARPAAAGGPAGRRGLCPRRRLRHGAGSTAPRWRRGIAIGVEPDGHNINQGCGSTCLDTVAAAVRAQGADVGIAHDGDADRCLAVDADGQVVDGDQILAVLATELKEEGRLAGDTVVVTVMSNLGFRLAMDDAGIQRRRDARRGPVRAGGHARRASRPGRRAVRSHHPRRARDDRGRDPHRPAPARRARPPRRDAGRGGQGDDPVPPGAHQRPRRQGPRAASTRWPAPSTRPGPSLAPPAASWSAPAAPSPSSASWSKPSTPTKPKPSPAASPPPSTSPRLTRRRGVHTGDHRTPATESDCRGLRRARSCGGGRGVTASTTGATATRTWSSATATSRS